MREKVIVIGGGVAGLTAAHELVERDFEVHVFERRLYLGGKAASVPVPENPAPGPNDRRLPGEHGFRFFPGWYKHLSDTLERIPYQGRRNVYEGTKVSDNLVTIRSNLLTWSNKESIPLPLRVPTSVGELARATDFLQSFGRLGFTRSDVTFFAAKLAAFLAVREDKRAERFEAITWWDYLGCADRSQPYQDLVRATTRTLIAAKAEEVSAYTLGTLAARTLLDTLSTVDRVLNGPTNDAWIGPWRKYLESRGVKFHMGLELDSLVFSRKASDLESVSFEPFTTAEARRLRRVLAGVHAQLAGLVSALQINAPPPAQADHAALFSQLSTDDRPISNAMHETVLQLGADLEKDVDAARSYLEGLTSHLTPGARPPESHTSAADAAAAELEALKTEIKKLPALPSWAQLSRVASTLSTGTPATDTFLRLVDSPLPSALDEIAPQRADYFVFALPLEQMAYYVNRSPALTELAPELRGLLRLSYYLDWMSGIQFYLGETLELPGDHTDGHIVCLDSEWSLTAIEQTNHWHDVTWPSDVKGILSVDIARWDRRGRLIQKEPYNCTDSEIAKEVWAQLKVQLNRRSQVLRDDMLRGAATFDGPGPHLRKDYNYHVDDALVEIRDRKKQALYERARGVRFSASALQQSALDEAEPPTDSYMWGPHVQYNVEPLLVNRVGSRQFRPASQTSVRNMFLAGDYVLTKTDLACMEGANESARVAVNGILDATGSRAERCRLWSFSALGDLAKTASTFSPAGMVELANRGVSDAWQSAKDRLQGFGEQLAARRQRLDK